MRLASIRTGGDRHLALVAGDVVHDLTAASKEPLFASVESVLEGGDAGLDRVRSLAEQVVSRGDHVTARSETLFAPPLANPSQVLAVGRNYLDHANEVNADLPELPRIFPKWPSTVIGDGEPIVRPSLTSQMDWEVELAVVIGRHASHVSEEDALDHVFGYTILNDISARDLQASKPEQLALGKNFRTFTPMGAWICLTDEVPDPRELELRTWRNGELMQEASTSLLIFDVKQLISFLSRVLDLRPGDVISTGTPAGIGWFRNPPTFLDAGDRLRMTISRAGEDICELANPVTSETAVGAPA